MSRYLIFTILVASALSDSIENYQGDWRPIKVYGEEATNPTCVPGHVRVTNYTCKCGNQDAPIVALKIPGQELSVAALVAKTNEKVIDAVRVKCDVNGHPVPLLVFRPLSDGYMIMYTGEQGIDKFVLLRQRIPSQEELENFEKTVEVLNTKQGTVICVKVNDDSNHTKRGSSNKPSTNVWAIVKN